jgi:hypothetical protein
MIHSFQLQSIKTVLFTQRINLSKPIEIAGSFMSNAGIGNLYNGQPTILPIPQDAPSEIPRIILKNENKSYFCNISQDRIDFTFKRRTPNATLQDASDTFLNHLISHVDVVNNILRVPIIRIGIIITLVLPLKISSNKFVSEKFLRENLFENSHDITLGVLRKEQLAGFETNCWVKMNTMRNKKDQLDDRALIIIYDINTPPEKLFDLSRDQVSIFYNSSIKYVLDNIKVYFME